MKLSYVLPLWPNLLFYFVGIPGMPAVHDFGFARSPKVQQVSLNKY
jgi:hypothetical protein